MEYKRDHRKSHFSRGHQLKREFAVRESELPIWEEVLA